MRQPHDSGAGTLLLASQHLSWLTCDKKIGFWWRQLATALVVYFGPEVGTPLALGLKEAICIVAGSGQEAA